MGPLMVLDKSAIQSFNHQEISILTRYFTINIPQVLIVEIIADLTKGSKSTLNPDEVTKIARKIHPKDTAFNQYFRDILVQDLLKGVTDLNRAKIYIDSVPVESSGGKKGYKATVSAEEKAFNKWKEGKFDFNDEFLAKRWRKLTDEIDLDELIRNLKTNSFFQKKLRSLDEAAEYLNSFLTKTNGKELLEIAIKDFAIEPEFASEIFHRWESNGFKSFKKFSPFGFFCLKTVTMFYLSLVNELITQRPTNRVDLDYIFYLPFCNVFVSNDKFHRRIVPRVHLDYTDFVRGDKLKEDLNRIIDFLETNKKSAYKKRPPSIENSVINELWEKHMGPKRDEDLLSQMDSKKKEELLEDLKKYWNSTKGRSETSPPNFEDHEFFIREREILLTDPCICGSGLEFKNCCYKKSQNN